MVAITSTNIHSLPIQCQSQFHFAFSITVNHCFSTITHDRSWCFCCSRATAVTTALFWTRNTFTCTGPALTTRTMLSYDDLKVYCELSELPYVFMASGCLLHFHTKFHGQRRFYIMFLIRYLISNS